MATGGQVIEGLLSRLFRSKSDDVAGSGPRLDANGVAKETVETTGSAVAKAIGLEISDKALRDAGFEAAEKALKSSGGLGRRKASEALVTSRAENAMKGVVQTAAETKYLKELDDAGTKLKEAIDSGDLAKIKAAEFNKAKVESAISDEVSAYLKENGDEISGMAAKIGSRVKNGGIGYKTTTGVLSYAGKHPVYTTAAAGGGLYALSSSDSEITNNVLSTGADVAGGVLGTAFNAVNGAFNLGANALSPIFDGATGLLEYTGIDPKYANIAVGLGTFFALKAALNVALEQTGLGKIMPGVAGFGVLILAGVMAYKIADSAGAFESVADINDKPVVATAPTGPAMAPA